MPNNITNRLEIKGTDDQLSEVLEAINGEQGIIDFNKIIRMPESLFIDEESYSMNIQDVLFGNDQLSLKLILVTQRVLTDMDEQSRKKYVEIALTRQSNQEKYGHASWYEWSKEHWGTKWNAYNQYLVDGQDNAIYFETAWISPYKVIAQLSKMYPEVEFEVKYVDECPGEYSGIYAYKNGEEVKQIDLRGKEEESYELFFEIHPNCRKDYRKLKDGTYEWIVEEDDVED
ncbi:hypothetical protein [Algivirga pacifica]|uniref:YubB ferredoxin-like domain-containing protein n=1 Tax=Algivirga pacifica TaxID=1162670 RepID=A0ABP9D7T4_9BACT